MARTDQRCRHSRRGHRRGYTLVFCAMILFAFMALAALLIDIGFARLAQRQMQVAADSAAVEGLRGAGSLDYSDRRDAARDFVAWHFDDDLDSSNGDDGAFNSGSGEFGAGPLVEFTGGAGDPTLVASQMMSVDSNGPVYKPVMLDGTASATGFQVAIQRGVPNVPAADLYSLGPAVPYLFARGSLLNRQLIQDGITVRGTGVAHGRRVLSIGRANSTVTPALPGLAPFALDVNYWNGLANGTADLQPEMAGEIGTVGQFFDAGASGQLPVVIGRTLPDVTSPADGTFSGYVTIYAPISDGTTTTHRVVGFGRATAVVTSGTMRTVEITRQAQQVAAENASAVVCYPVELSSIELVNVFAENANVAESLLAPVSGR